LKPLDNSEVVQIYSSDPLARGVHIIFCATILGHCLCEEASFFFAVTPSIDHQHYHQLRQVTEHSGKDKQPEASDWQISREQHSL